MFTVSAVDLKSWRHAARALLQRKISPCHVSWAGHGQQVLAFDDKPYQNLPIVNPKPLISREFLRLLVRANCFQSEDKWALFYSLAFRIVYEDKALLKNALDAQVKTLTHWHQTICRDIHKMEAFVRFQRLEHEKVGTVFVAWFEPEHAIFATAAPFFINRFNNMQWSILSPEMCMHWNREALYFTSGVTRPQGLTDEVESLWCEYYRSIFNPARLKVNAMQSEMPKKYWRNLPEAAIIHDLIASAAHTTQRHIDTAPAPRWNKTAHSKFVQQFQQYKKIEDKFIGIVAPQRK